MKKPRPEQFGLLHAGPAPILDPADPPSEAEKALALEALIIREVAGRRANRFANAMSEYEYLNGSR